MDQLILNLLFPHFDDHLILFRILHSNLFLDFNFPMLTPFLKTSQPLIFRFLPSPEFLNNRTPTQYRSKIVNNSASWTGTTPPHTNACRSRCCFADTRPSRCNSTCTRLVPPKPPWYLPTPYPGNRETPHPLQILTAPDFRIDTPDPKTQPNSQSAWYPGTGNRWLDLGRIPMLLFWSSGTRWHFAPRIPDTWTCKWKIRRNRNSTPQRRGFPCNPPSCSNPESTCCSPRRSALRCRSNPGNFPSFDCSGPRTRTLSFILSRIYRQSLYSLGTSRCPPKGWGWSRSPYFTGYLNRDSWFRCNRFWDRNTAGHNPGSGKLGFPGSAGCSWSGWREIFRSVSRWWTRHQRSCFSFPDTADSRPAGWLFSAKTPCTKKRPRFRSN